MLRIGFTPRGHKQKSEESWDKFFTKNYHKTIDDIADLTNDFGTIRYDYGALFADINYAISTEIANAPARPNWNKESFFGKTFDNDYNTVK